MTFKHKHIIMKSNYFYALIPIFHLILQFQLNAQKFHSLNTASYFEAPLIGKRYLPPPSGEGSPFLFNGVINGDIIVETGDTLKNKMLKFDALRNELIWVNDLSEYVSLDSSNIKAFTLYPEQNKEPHHFTKIQIKLPFKPDSTNYYLETLNDSLFVTYAYRYIEIKNKQVIIDGVLREINIFKSVSTYYIKLGSLPIKQIALNKRSLINAFPEYKKEMKKILNKTNIKAIKNENQLKAAIKDISRNISLSNSTYK